ncbi:MAG: hypothetical protein QW507_03140 [Candidatus Nanoarchaeia archaeon]|nr:hypothetical protein [Candidatus Haiyanarchaeum thermophilum]MCW1303226.1 hypothetical protein [Candidatus Haiyanarchaeum thermophilum]MCW1304043.1 hypothetical protein [Candidatus Haiyanarchaeum thermophilum]MCW1306782.1 hypothetical protein [Candidatus Haiyanarchaeum thermophilum]MCW1307473.1 hypothetical protein [Candidatus Haiyanarchaeum thermophilum]
MAKAKERSIVVKSLAKEIAKKKGVRFPDEAIEALDKFVRSTIECAAERAKKNNRKTIRSFDF